jgi:hypothetical protein
MYLYEHIIRKIKMAVSINIPGIGTIDVQGVAAESTLKEILTVLKNGGGGRTGGGGSTTGGGDGGGTGGSDSIGNIGPTLSKGKVSLGLFSAKLLKASEQLGDLGNSASSAATLFSQIPVLGEVFAVVGRSADKMLSAFTTATDSGAAFGGSILSFSRSASDAGMQLEEFGRLVARNGVAMGAFGTTSEDGAKNFARVSKTLRTTSSELYALGFTTSDINEGLASYGNLLRIQGLQGTKTNSQLALGAKSYLKEMDMLAKVTGEERAAKEKERENLAVDGMFRAAMSGLSDDVESSFSTLIQAMPNKAMQDFAKDMVSNGTATTAANQLVLSQMPELGAQLTALHQQTQSNVKVSRDQMNQTLNIGRIEGPAALHSIKTAVAASQELQEFGSTVSGWRKVNKDSIKESTAQQIEAAENSDKFNEGMQEMQQALSSISNVFTAFLVNTVFLDTMVIGVKLIGVLLHEVLVPALSATADFITSMLVPAFTSVTNFLKDNLYPAFLNLAGYIIVDVIRPLQVLGAEIASISTKLLEYLDPAIKIFSKYFTSISEGFSYISSLINDKAGPAIHILAGMLGTITALYIAQNVVGWISVAATTALGLASGIAAVGMSILAGAVNLLTLPISALILGVGLAVAAIKALYDRGWTLSSAFEALQDNLSRFGLTLSETMDDIRVKLGSWIGGLNEDEASRRQSERANARAILDEREKARDIERKRLETERNKNKEVDRAAEGAKINNILLSQANKFGTALGITATSVEKDAKTINANTGSEGLLTAFVNKEGGRFANNADNTRSGMVNDATVKQAAAEAAAEAAKNADAEAAKNADAEAAKNADAEAKKSGIAQPQSSSQVSAETLLSQLNSMMSQLIRINQEQNEIAKRQVYATESMSNDLFIATSN